MKSYQTDDEREAGTIFAIVAEAIFKHRFNFSVEFGDNKKRIPTKITLEIGAEI